MLNNLPEKYVSSVITFGDRGPITASSTAIVKGYLTAPGGTNAAAVEFAVVIPRKGRLKNLYWSAEASTLTATGNSMTVYVKDPQSLPSSSPSSLKVLWNTNTKSGSNVTNSVPVNEGATVSIYFQLAKGSGILTRPRVSFELEVDAQEPNPWDLTGTTVSYVSGNVGIGTTSPTAELHVKNTLGTAGVFESTGKILSGTDGVTEKFSVKGNGDVYISGKVGIGTTTPSTELDVNGTIQTKGVILTTGAGNGFVLTSDAGGNGTWQPTGGASGTIDGSGTPNAIPRFLGSTTLDDSQIFQNGNNIGIGTATPNTTLDVNGAISGFGIVPVGSIIAWHKSFATFALPDDSWVECNGQTLSDIGSIYNGQTIPDLNNSGRFLRGAATSGAMQNDEMQSHKHVEPGHSHLVSLQGNGQPGSYGTYASASYNPVHQQSTSNSVQVQLGDPVDSATGAGTARHGSETRPINMSVVWIIRVK